MPDHFRGQRSPSPRHGPPIAPPLSKYYYGPTKGWNSMESSPSHNGSTWSSNHQHELPPVFPPRLFLGPPANTAAQLMNNAPYAAESLQGWHSPDLPPSAPSHSPVNPTWDTGNSDTSMWGVKYNHDITHGSKSVSKPPLPPRPQQSPDQYAPHESKTPSSRLSATTIDVPLFLQPVAYDPALALPLPVREDLQSQDTQTSASSPPEPQRLPPPPPQKIPLGYQDGPQAQRIAPQRPCHEPHHSFDGGQQTEATTLRRPRFDHRNSQNEGASSYQRKYQGQQPTIPPPQFTSFNVESALPPVEQQSEPSVHPKPTQPASTSVDRSNDGGRYHAVDNLHKLSVSPIGPSDGERWEASSKPWEPQAAYVPSPEQQLTVVSQHDGQSISTTDLSSNHAGLSTPESQQTSNTSYHRDVENQAGSIKHEQQGDDSFYWHSGRSSSDPGEEDQSRSGSPTATPGDDRAGPRSSIIDSTDPQHEHQDAPIRAPSLSLTMSGAYGASALGFGGPSDWEYFGDYEAEEIDDEELYSKPRARLSETMVGGSAELLADFPLDARQERGGWELPGSEPDSRDLLLLPDKPPERSLVTGPSSAIVPQESPKSGESDYKVITGSPSAQALVTPRVTPSHEAALLDTSHDQQRPHMDDVIRAWSEAPHVGKVHDEALITQSSLDNDEEPAEVAEASLESTPRDRLLGVAVILRNVPSLPKLPKSIEEHGHDTSSASLNNMMITKDHDTYSVDAQISTIQTILHIDQANSGDMVQKGLSPSEISTESSLSSRRVLSEPSAGGTSLEGAPPVEESRNSVINEQPQSQREVIQTDPVGITQSSSQESVRDLRQPLAQDLQEKKPLAALRADQGDIEDGMANASLQSVGDPSAPTLHRATIQSSQQFSQEEPHPSESDIMEETLRPDSSQTEEGFPKNISLDDLHAQDDTAANQINLGEKTEISKIHAAVDELPSKDDIRSSPRQLDQPAPNDETPFSDDRPLPETHRLIDPYSDLDPWGKASLNRFAAMLREESRAENNKDKLNIFNVFTTRESRLRVILYGTEDELLITQGKAEKTPVVQHKPEKEKQAVQRANTMNVERSLKALPALPPDRESVLCSPRKALAPLLPQNEGRQSGARSMPSDINHKFKSEVEPIDQPSGDTHQTQLNFGGRPKVSPVPNSPQMIDAYSAKDASPSLVNDTSPSTKAVEVLEGSNTPISNARIAPRSEVERKAPVYVPLLFNEGPSEIKNYLANRKSVYRPYATLTQGSLDSGSNFGREPDVNIGGTASGLITAPTSLYNPNSQSKVVNLPDISTTKKQKVLEAGEARDLRRFVNADFHPLLLVLPQSNAVINDPSRLQDLKNVMEAVPDEFGFIHQSVVAWDAKAKKQREENDRQRHARQVESEQRIDSLFDDHEIGYGDISELESEFKRSEAARKADEDRSEYQTFVSEVFNIVWTRLHFELDQLIPHYEQYSTLMNNTLAGRDMFEDPEGLALAPTMSCFLALHQKVEIRHQKAFEAVLERDRRLKKTEISPWYTLSNISKVKQLEKQFEDAEKRAIIEYCQQRDARANRLMDVLDQNTLRGVGANQDYMEAIMKAVRRIASGRAFASVTDLSEPTAGLEEVEKAKATTALLTTSSEQIVQTFHVADMLLNSADYEVSVAKAKVAKADLATLAKLKEERAKEDQKLMRDLEHRLALIREDSRRTNEEIVKLLLFLGVQNGRAHTGPAEPADPGHDARIQKALEEAKRRNALKESGG